MKMTKAYHSYKIAMRQLLEGREAKAFSEAEEDALLERMDDLWWAMEPYEQELFDRAAEKDAGD